jgi:hypothetical protein
MPYESIGYRLRREKRLYDTLKADYEGVRATLDPGLPPYDELTDEQRAKHKASWRELHAFYDKLGKAIRDGTELPDPFEDH